MKNICVFCGSRKGTDAIYAETVKNLGKILAKREKALIYGGGNVGLMGILADSVMAEGGSVTGVIPEFLIEREVGHHQINELIVVKSMHERKQKMAEIADGFMALPGGYGTLEELSEILTWVQLRLISKPVALLNINNFFEPLLLQLRTMINEGFLTEESRSMLLVGDDPESLIEKLEKAHAVGMVNLDRT